MTAGKLRGLSNKVHAASPIRLILHTDDGPREIECDTFEVHTERDASGKPVAMPELTLNFRPGKLVAKSVSTV
jgi:hypothetical protein